MIELAERYLHELGLDTCRVRYHQGDLARIEVPLSAIGRLVSMPLRDQLASHFRELGFRFITLDVEGFRSGNLNQLVQISG